MTIVRVFGNSFVNPSHVGTVQVSVDFDDAQQTRKTGTRIFDAAGTHMMLKCETTVSTNCDDPQALIAVKIDNELHAEIVAAIKEQRDAKTYAELEAVLSQK